MSTRRVRRRRNRKRKEPVSSSDSEDNNSEPASKRRKLDEKETKCVTSTNSIDNQITDSTTDEVKDSAEKVTSLVVDGYIRSINTTLFDNTIPNVINKLCHLYQTSFNKFNIVCHQKDDKDNSKWNLVLIDIDGENKQKYTISPTKLKYNHRPNPILHIDNISKYLPSNMTNNNHRLNAIFGVTLSKPENAVSYDDEPVVVDKDMVINRLMQYSMEETNSFKRNAYKKACNSIRRTSRKSSEYHLLSGMNMSVFPN